MYQNPDLVHDTIKSQSLFNLGYTSLFNLSK